MPVNRRSPRPPNSTQIAGSRHRHRRQLWDYGQSACTPGPSARQWTHVSPRCVVRLRAFGRCQGVPSTPVGRLAMRNAVRSTNLVTGAARTIGKPACGLAQQPRATWAPAPANCESGLYLPPGAAIRLAKFHTSCQFRHQFGICRQSLRRTPGGTGSFPAGRHSSMMRYAAGRSDADRIQNYRVGLNHVRR